LLIYFASNKLQKQCSSLKKSQKKWGVESGKLIMRRLDEILASNNLEILKAIHPRCHPMTGDRKGKWSVDLKHPYRLYFVIANDPIPTLKDGSVDCKKVTKIKIIEVEDPHGRRAKK